MYAMREKPGNRDTLGRILAAQALTAVGNTVLDAFEPGQRKREEEKDFGDKLRDTTRNLLNIASGGYTAYQLAQGYGILGDNNATEGPAPGPTGGSPSPTGSGPAPTSPSAGPLMLPPAATTTERARRGEELTRQARSERMPGVMMADLSQMVDEDMMRRLKGLEAEAAAYPKPSTEPSDYEKGVAAGMEAMTMRKLNEGRPLAQAPALPAAETPQTPAVRSPDRSANPLLRQEPKDFNETFNQRRDTETSSEMRDTERAERLGNFYASLPTDPNTGERDLGFATSFLARKGAIDPDTVVAIDPEVDMPRKSGGLLAGQLQGETAFDQQQNRQPFVQDQQMDAIYTADEQGPGFKSPSIGELFLANAQAMAQSDANLYRSVGERINNMKQILNEAENPREQKAAQLLQDTLGSTMNQIAKKERPSFVPTPEMVGNYVKPEFRAAEDPEMVEEAKRSQEQKARGEQFFANSSRGSRVGRSRTLDTAEETPVVKKTTIIEETAPAPQVSMSPMEASEKLRRIQTSGRPTARQEAQDFLQSIKGQMING